MLWVLGILQETLEASEQSFPGGKVCGQDSEELCGLWSLCKGKTLESGFIGQMSHLGIGFLNAAQLSQTAPSPDFISSMHPTDLRLSLGSVLGLNQSSPISSKAESSKCFIPNTDFYSPIIFSHSHFPLFPTFSSVSLSPPSSFSLSHSSAAYLGLSFCLTKARSSAGRTQSCDSPHHAWHLVLLENCRSLWFSLSCPIKALGWTVPSPQINK